MRLLLINPNTNTKTTREMVQIAQEVAGSDTAVLVAAHTFCRLLPYLPTYAHNHGRDHE